MTVTPNSEGTRSSAPLPDPAEETIFRVAVEHKPPEVEKIGNELVKAAQQLGITELDTCQVGRLFYLQGQLTLAQANQIAAEDQPALFNIADLPLGHRALEAFNPNRSFGLVGVRGRIGLLLPGTLLLG